MCCSDSTNAVVLAEEILVFQNFLSFQNILSEYLHLTSEESQRESAQVPLRELVLVWLIAVL